MNKAEAMGLRMAQRYGVDFRYQPEHLKKNVPGYRNHLCIGCVDTIDARKLMADAANYLDCGNTRGLGQVVYGHTADKVKLSAELTSWDKGVFVKNLPSPAVVLDFDNLQPSPGAQSCADQPFDEQGVFINSWMASAALNILHQIFVIGQVSTPMIAVNFDRGQMTSSVINKTYYEQYSI